MGLKGSWKESTEVITNSRKTRECLLTPPLPRILSLLLKPDLSVTHPRKVLTAGPSYPPGFPVSPLGDSQSNTGLKKL